MDLKENRITVRELLATVAAREVLAPGTSGYLRAVRCCGWHRT